MEISPQHRRRRLPLLTPIDGSGGRQPGGRSLSWSLRRRQRVPVSGPRQKSLDRKRYGRARRLRQLNRRSVFDGTLRQGLAVQLEQSPFLRVISDERMQQEFRLMGQPADARIDPQVAREVCERTSSAAVLYGSIASLGSNYVLGLQAKDCRSGDVLAEEQVQADRKEDLLHALDQIASRFRSRVGESLTTVRKYDTPLAEATTPSLEALKAYSAGLQMLSSQGSAAALPLFKHAIALDPKFAMAYAVQGHAYGEIGESDLSAESMSKAYQLQDHASDREKFYINASYDFRVTGNLEKVEQNCLAWAQAYPRDETAPGILAGVVYPAFAKYEKVVEEAEQSGRA